MTTDTLFVLSHMLSQNTLVLLVAGGGALVGFLWGMDKLVK
jgi:hypothetical protein